MSDFRIKKWYLDCTSEDGKAFIGYVGELKWKAFSLSHSSILDYDGKKSQNTASISDVNLPEIKENKIIWKSNALSCSGQWEGKGNSLPNQQLYKGSAGSVNWDVLFPLSEVSIERFGSAENQKGLGYAEILELTIPPWKLPIDQLIWGRFVSPEISIVWLKWSGSNPIESIFLNGSSEKAPSVSPNMISWETGTLKHIITENLRDGPLIKTALKKIPGIKSIFPKKILNLYETKWLSSSEALINGKKYSGWSIHELVKF